MDRRKFLKSSVAAGITGAAALGSASCSSVKFLEESVPEEPAPDLDEVLARMDDGMREISEWDPVDDFLGPAPEGVDRTAANRVVSTRSTPTPTTRAGRSGIRTTPP